MTQSDTNAARVSRLDVLWADAELEEVRAGDERLELRLHEATGRKVRLVADGYIAYERVGVWDELIVETGALADHGPLMERSLAELASVMSTSSGSPARNTKAFRELTVRFLDGTCLRVVAAGFETIVDAAGQA